MIKQKKNGLNSKRNGLLSKEDRKLPKEIQKRLIAIRQLYGLLADLPPKKWKQYMEASDRHSKTNRNV